MRKKIVAGNWKMNLTIQEGVALVHDIIHNLPDGLNDDREVVIAPPATHIASIYTDTQDVAHLCLAGQTCHHLESGAYTGEISAQMLWTCGASYVIIGHSERREYNAESDQLLAKKVDAALAAGLDVIFCCGEPLEIRDADGQNNYVGSQIAAGIFHLTPEQMKKVSVAYEPIWAIGTGRTASAQQAQDMHAHIRAVLWTQYGEEIAANAPILYGGSCKPSNAAELFACPDVDGGLIGGASLKAEDFLGIIKAMLAA